MVPRERYNCIQRGTRTRSLEIRSLARYHCASQTFYTSLLEMSGDSMDGVCLCQIYSFT